MRNKRINKQTLWFVSLALLPGINLSAQEQKTDTMKVGPVIEKVDDTLITETPKLDPIYPGGERAFLEFLSRNIKYPSICQEQNVQGYVVASFVVDTDGTITDIQTPYADNSTMAKEVQRVLGITPRWNPGKEGKRNVRVKFSMPVLFHIAGEDTPETPDEILATTDGTTAIARITVTARNLRKP